MHVLLFYNCVLTVVKYTDMLCYVMLCYVMILKVAGCHVHCKSGSVTETCKIETFLQHRDKRS